MNKSFVKTCLLSKKTSHYALLWLCLFMLTGWCSCNDGEYYDAMRTRQDLIQLAEQLRVLDPGNSLPDRMLVRAEEIGDATAERCKTGAPTDDFHNFRIGGKNMASVAYDRITELGGNPNVPDNPYYEQAPSTVHGSTGDQ